MIVAGDLDKDALVTINFEDGKLTFAVSPLQPKSRRGSDESRMDTAADSTPSAKDSKEAKSSSDSAKRRRTQA